MSSKPNVTHVLADRGPDIHLALLAEPGRTLCGQDTAAAVAGHDHPTCDPCVLEYRRLLDGEEYPLTLTPAEAEYLDRQLEYLGRNSGHGPATRIRERLAYAPPRYAVGTKVTRRSAPWDTAVHTVVGHRWVSPGNWTAWLDGGFGVGEFFLDPAEPT